MFRRSPQNPAPGAVAARSPRPAAGDRLYVVGDVHGRIDLLELMLRKILADFVIRAGDGRRPKVIFIGDILDRGDFARDVVRKLRALSGRTGPYGEVITLMGNHEAALLAFLDDPARGARWLRYGGMQTLASYGVGSGFPLVLPFLGPSNLRDGISLIPNAYLSPTFYFTTSVEGVGLSAVERFNLSSLHIGEYESLKQDALDPYTLFRDAYQQHRENLIEE